MISEEGGFRAREGRPRRIFAPHLLVVLVAGAEQGRSRQDVCVEAGGVRCRVSSPPPIRRGKRRRPQIPVSLSVDARQNNSLKITVFDDERVGLLKNRSLLLQAQNAIANPGRRGLGEDGGKGFLEALVKLAPYL